MSKMLSKIDLEDREHVADLMASAGWKPLLTLIEQLVREQDEAVLTYNLSRGLADLGFLKAQSEGAHKLRDNIIRLKEHFNARKER